MNNKIERLTAGTFVLSSMILLPGIAGSVETGSLSLKSGTIWTAIVLGIMGAMILIREVYRG